MLKAAGKHGRLAKLIHEGMVKASASVEAEATDYFRGSQTDQCDRKIFFARIGEEITNPFPPLVLEKFTKGNMLHDHLRKLIPTHTDYHVSLWNPEKEVEHTFTVNRTPVTIRMHMDGVLEHVNIPLFRSLLEIKSTSLYGYKSTIQLAFTDPAHYSMNYFTQTNRYLGVWNAKYPDNPLNTLTLLVYNVNGDEDKLTHMPFRDFWFEPDKALFKEDLRRLARIERKIHACETPEKHYKEKDWQCKGCLYLHSCWPEKGKRGPGKPVATGRAKKARRVPAARKQTKRGSVSRRSRSLAPIPV